MLRKCPFVRGFSAASETIFRSVREPPHLAFLIRVLKEELAEVLPRSL